MGRLTKDPELRQTNNGIPVTGFSVAVDRNLTKDKERVTDFFDVVCWQTRAEFVAKHFTKGQQIALDGRLQQRKWTDRDGNAHYAVEIIAESVHFAGFKKNDTHNGGQDDSYYDGEDHADVPDEGFDPFAEAAA
jgi:single-strand DNA-binding protein